MPGYARPVTVVVTPASNHDLTDLATVKGELNITSTDSARDAVLTRYITAAAKAAEQFCNRVFAVETVKDSFYPQRDAPLPVVLAGPNPLQLSRWPITTLTSVVENGVTLTEDTDFTADYAIGQLIRLDLNGYPRQWRLYPIVVQYAAGYATIPVDVADASIRGVVRRWFARGRDVSVKSETVPGVYSASYAQGNIASVDGNLAPDECDLLDNYRVPVVYG